VALAADAAEAGDSFELAVNMRPATGKADLFYQNRTTGQGGEGAGDFAVISHACKNAAARAADYSVAKLNWLDLSGTATVTAIEIGCDPLIVFGDSQALVYLGPALQTAFDTPRMLLRAGISGNQLCDTATNSHTAGYLRYKHTTPGLGDLCEMTGCIFVIAGIGVNDVSGESDTDAKRNAMAMRFAARVADILYDLQARAVPALVIGLPPYSDGDANTYEAHCIKSQINPVLEGLAIGARCAFVNPWFDMVDPVTANEDIPTFNAAYTTDAGLHYNAAGASVVAALAVEAVESGVVGGPWTQLGGRRPGVMVGVYV
jgi:hypothetical protein